VECDEAGARSVERFLRALGFEEAADAVSVAAFGWDLSETAPAGDDWTDEAVETIRKIRTLLDRCTLRSRDQFFRQLMSVLDDTPIATIGWTKPEPRRPTATDRGVEAGVAQNVRERSGQSTPETAPAAVQAATEQRACNPEVPGSIPGPRLDSALDVGDHVIVTGRDVLREWRNELGVVVQTATHEVRVWLQKHDRAIWLYREDVGPDACWPRRERAPGGYVRPGLRPGLRVTGTVDGGHIEGEMLDLFIDGVAWAVVRWDGETRGVLVDPEILGSADCASQDAGTVVHAAAENSAPAAAPDAGTTPNPLNEGPPCDPWGRPYAAADSSPVLPKKGGSQ
jgi:hypothetical protein